MPEPRLLIQERPRLVMPWSGVRKEDSIISVLSGDKGSMGEEGRDLSRDQGDEPWSSQGLMCLSGEGGSVSEGT